MTAYSNEKVEADPTPWAGLFPNLSTEPNCSEYQIGLAQTVTASELARLAPQVDMALGGKTRELSKGLVKKPWLARPTNAGRNFCRIVQVRELSSLANTLDNDLVTFIKQVLN